VSFDIGLIERFGLIVHAFDPTPKSIAWVKDQDVPDSFLMHEHGIGSFDGTGCFYPPKKPDEVSHTILRRPATASDAIMVPLKRLATIMEELGHNEIHILKLDIEGAEYDVIDDIAASSVRPNQILVEFHHRFRGVRVRQTRDALEAVRSLGYRLFSVVGKDREFGFVRDSFA
jgi:FkbM family methyltransferase